MFSFIALTAPDSRWAGPVAAAVALPSLARAPSIRAAASAAKLVSTMGTPPPAVVAGLAGVAAFLARDLVVALLTLGVVDLALGARGLAAPADLVVDLVVFFET